MSPWQTTVRAALCGAYKYSGAMALHEALLRACDHRFLTILLYHRVTDAIPEDGLTVHPERFRDIAKMLHSRFRVVPLAEAFRLIREGQPIPPRTVAITFDDSYHDNLPAARVLAELGLHATFFIPTGFVGTRRRFDWDLHLPEMPNLTWDDVREISRLGHDIGSHTVNHFNLGQAGPDEAREELINSKKELEEQLQRRVRFLAYPFGGRNDLRPEYVPLIEEAGYEGVVSAYGGFVFPSDNARLLPREAVPYFKSLLHLEMHLSGCLHWLYRLTGRLRAAPLPAPAQAPAALAATGIPH
jgi:peptidoglycan/xylan/chitin deacetylase (PgdA/CDA1 family)